MSKTFQDKLKKSRDARERFLLGLNIDSSPDERSKSNITKKTETTDVKKDHEENFDPYQKTKETAPQDVIHDNKENLVSKGETILDTNTSVANYQPQSTQQEQLVFRPKRYKKQTLQETHVQRSYYIEKEIVEIIEEIVGGDTGGKYRFVNDALKLLIFQEYPEYAHRIKKSD